MKKSKTPRMERKKKKKKKLETKAGEYPSFFNEYNQIERMVFEKTNC